ncbi:ral GTPase-activating protein subunit beta-like isoform X2 [Portunus trituberculatus]|uniref:ral GTPase-activating protein subunit beta-like isoform X2 n=1 Tax=Portunus trituberculatus TaxID=210409 RepID=UPI001E1CF5E5|nr:ral GTPase-activating protein subunit beta-like isoform X2 [Portunus trituberculatus]XP_045133684.1 ral GTPase-activating protein subunit beta-like isoform X2 [Portunus trituberculatus]
MFSDWPSELVPQQGWGDEAAISAFKDAIPWTVGRDFVAGTAKHLAGSLGLTKPDPPTKSKIIHDKQLQVLMPALGHGLSFPLSEIDILRDCVNVYCEWLSALLPNPKSSVPSPILNDPNHYARIIINHFYYLFVPRGAQGPDVINRQAVLCHRVLRTLQNIAQNSPYLSEDTWQTLLMFLLHINSALLSPPTVKVPDESEGAPSSTLSLNFTGDVAEDAGEQLCERVLSVLFETWLLACARCFPPPPLWNALRESCQRWRHRAGLIEQWNRINFALTRKLICFMYGSSFPEISISEDDLNIIPTNMSKDCIAQVWYRILHIIGNPVDLSRHTVISKTPAFLKYAISSALVIEPSQHPCLQMLPSIFLTAMKGISGLVDAFLGVPNTSLDNLNQKGRQISPSSVSLSSDNKDDGARLLANGRPKCNSILHLFGPWLFEAALINCNLQASPGSQHKSDAGGGASSGSRRPVSGFGGEITKKTSDASASGDHSERLTNLMPQHFQGGRAEALGALCRIFCSKKTGEEILPVYLARFYIALHQGLREADAAILSPHESSQPPTQRYSTKTGMCSETAASVLVNGVDLFRLDLQGVVSLVPSVLGVLECVLPEGELSTPLQLPVTLLRRAATHILLSILPLPLHFQGLQVKEIGNNSGERLALSHLRPQLVNLLTNALQVETDPSNTQMLLGGLLFCVQDAALCEVMDSISQHNFSTDRDHNIMSSGASDTVSSHGDYNSLLDETCEALPEGGLGQMSATSFPSSSTTTTTHATMLTTTDGEATPILEDSDSAHALFVRSIYLVCHRLISSWKSDVNVSLAGLELLSGLARLSIAEQDGLECKRAVKWLCDYIASQCYRPPRAHSKDLHSTIVAAFHCASVWLVAHPYLLQDKECLATVLEVVELGISGSKSQVKSSDAPRLKHEKELKPASMRVRDAAEALLSCVLSQVGTFPSVCGAESLSSLLDEMTLLRHCNTWGGSDQLTRDSAAQHFRYFVAQNSIMLALLEQPLGNHQDPQPTVTALIRGPFGRVAWTMQLRHLPRHKSSAKLYTVNPGRPLPMNDVGIKHNVKPKYFPDSVERIPLCKADKSIPSLESVIMNEEKSTLEHEKLLQILDHQIAFEENVQRKVERETSEYPDVETECVAPSLCHEFQTARLLLSHFGFLSLDALQESVESAVPSLVALDSSMAGFARDLEILDNTNNRTVDTAHVFYVQAGQTAPLDILSNVVSCSSVHPHFMEFLNGLGWTVNVHQHPGWTGHVSTAFSVTPQSQEGTIDSNHGGSGFSGKSHVLYWSDALSEMAFVVPAPSQGLTTCHPSSSGNINTVGLALDSYEKVASGGGGGGSGSERSDSLPPCDADVEGSSSISSHASQTSYGQGSENRSRKFGRQTSAVACSDHKVYIVWLESFDDCYTFPALELLPETVTGLESSSWKDKEAMVYIIFIHALTNGLFRIRLQGQNAKLNMAGPLVDGQVVSRRVLGTLVRQTALNMCRRRRLESDSYQPPHVRRKLRIQEMVQRYRYEMNEPEFYTHLFTSPLC